MIILRLKLVALLLIGMSFICSAVFAQGHQERRYTNGGNRAIMNRGSVSQGRSIGQGNRHYYHNGNWNRNGWYGWGVQMPVFSDGVLVASLPPGYTTVVVSGNTYFYGNDMYFRQLSSGGFAVVTQP